AQGHGQTRRIETVGPQVGPGLVHDAGHLGEHERAQELAHRRGVGLHGPGLADGPAPVVPDDRHLALRRDDREPLHVVFLEVHQFLGSGLDLESLLLGRHLHQPQVEAQAEGHEQQNQDCAGHAGGYSLRRWRQTPKPASKKKPGNPKTCSMNSALDCAAVSSSVPSVVSFGAIVTRSFSSASQATACRMKSVLLETSRRALLAKSESPTSKTAGCRAFSEGFARATTKAARVSGPCVSFCGLKSRGWVILSGGVSGVAQLRGLDLARGWNTHSLLLLSRKLTGRAWGNMVKTWPRSWVISCVP